MAHIDSGSMQIVWQGQYKLMVLLPVYLHDGVWLASQYPNQIDSKSMGWEPNDKEVGQWPRPEDV